MLSLLPLLCSIALMIRKHLEHQPAPQNGLTGSSKLWQNNGQRELPPTASSLQFMGLLAGSSGLCGPFWEPLRVFSLSCFFTCSSQVGILFRFLIFAATVVCLLQHCAKPKVCIIPAWSSCSAGGWVWRPLSWAHRLGPFLAHDRVCAGGSIVGFLGGVCNPSHRHAPTCSCSSTLFFTPPPFWSPPHTPTPDMSGLVLQPGKIGISKPAFYFCLIPFYLHLNFNYSSN